MENKHSTEHQEAHLGVSVPSKLFNFTLDEEYLASHISMDTSSPISRELSSTELSELTAEKEAQRAAQAEDEATRKRSISLPPTEEMRRDWMRPNRRMSYLYPDVVLPSWRRV